MFNSIIEKLSVELTKPLPGEIAQYKMAPEGRRNFKNAANTTQAAVLVLLYPINDEVYTVFMKRPEYEGMHSGQISFPGGKYELTDPDYEYTALRETSEELGVPAETIKVLGKLSPLHIPVSGFNVHPFIAYTENRPGWKPDEKEVTRVIELPLSYLANPKCIRHEIGKLHNTELNVPFYFADNEKIWGATAMITAELIEIYRTSFQS